jgi:hypothetical protein
MAKLVALLWGAIVVGAVTSVVVFDEGDGSLLPGEAVGGVADHADAVAEAVQGCVVAARDGFEAELGGEIEDVTCGAQVVGRGGGGVGGGGPDPAALLGVLVPVVSHDYERHGVTSLFAAMDVASGVTISNCYRRHRHQEFLRFLSEVDANLPRGLEVHL